MAGARPIIDPPSVPATPYDLWSAVQTDTPAPAHWQQGVTWIDMCPDGGTTYDSCLVVTGTGTPPAPPAKADNVARVFRGATPFTVYAEFDCSPVGSLTEIETAAVDALARVEAHRLSETFSTGIAGGQVVAYPHLIADAEVADAQGIVLQTAAEVCTLAAVDVVEGLGLLEECLAQCYSGAGVIHVPVRALPTFQAWNLLVPRDDALWTTLGNRVVVGTGYVNASPSGVVAADSQAWIYATGQVFGYRSPNVFASRLSESLDRTENTVRMLAERTYVLGFSCCHHAAQVNIGVPES